MRLSPGIKTIRCNQFLLMLLALFFSKQILITPPSHVQLLQLFSIHAASCGLPALGGECVLCRKLTNKYLDGVRVSELGLPSHGL